MAERKGLTMARKTGKDRLNAFPMPGKEVWVRVVHTEYTRTYERMTPADARKFADQLIKAADAAEQQDKK